MSKTAQKSMKGIVVTIDRFEGSNDRESLGRYIEIENLLKTHFSGLRIRFGCAMSTLQSAPPVKRALRAAENKTSRKVSGTETKVSGNV